MGIVEPPETWTRVDLYCDGLGDDTATCVAYGSPNDIDADMPSVTDYCPSAGDARRQAREWRAPALRDVLALPSCRGGRPSTASAMTCPCPPSARAWSAAGVARSAPT